VLGQILPGVPVWKLGAESRFPNLAYIVFPGNVGDAHSLADVVRQLKPDLGKKKKPEPPHDRNGFRPKGLNIKRF